MVVVRNRGAGQLVFHRLTLRLGSPPTRLGQSWLNYVGALVLVGTALLAQPALLAAHPLPGSTITLSVDARDLQLAIAMPLDELNLALPDGAIIASPLDGGLLASDQLEQLTRYFDAHLAIQFEGSNPVKAKLTQARIDVADDEDIGAYDLLVMDMAVPVADNRPPLSVTLIYDAVMHQVRNHIATVLLQSQSHSPVLMGYIRFDPDLGKVAPFVLPH